MKNNKLLTFLIFIISNFSYSQFDLEKNKNIVHQFSFGENFEVFKNNKKNTYFITDEKEKIVFKKLKYCGNLNGSILQALDKNNNIIYFNSKIEKIKRPKQIIYTVCGSGSVYHLEILEQKQFYEIKKSTKKHFINGKQEEKVLFTFSFPKNDFDKIYLINGKKQLEYPDYDIYPMIVIYEKGLSYGVISNADTDFYDEISIKGKYLKVKKNNLWCYYNFTNKVKYKTLDDFIDDLAYFELTDGKSGYLDKHGNEYLK